MAGTVGDLYLELSPEDKDTVDTVVGAAASGQTLAGTDYPAKFEGLSEIQKAYVCFIVGMAPPVVSHAELEHFGVKGMKWGVRKDSSAGGLSGARAKGARLSKNFLSDKKFWTRSLPKSIALAAVGSAIGVQAPSILPKEVLSDIGFLVSFHSASPRQNLLSEKTYINIGKGTLEAIGGVTYLTGLGKAAGSTTAALARAGNTERKRTKQLKTLGNEDLKKTGKAMAARQAEGVKKVKTSLGKTPATKHEDVDNILEHFGIKGMKWGVRRSKEELAKASAKNTPASEDAINAVKTKQTINSTGSLNSVSSKDLQNLVNRMNLEQQYVRLTTESTPKKADGFIKKVLKNEADSLLLKGTKGPIVRGLDAALAASGKGKGKHRK